MSDENKPEFASKADLQVMFAAFEQKIGDMQKAHKTEMETQANQIHSSYSKKLKKLGLNESTNEEETEESPTRKPTKRELELQTNLEKLVREMEDSKTRVKMAERKQTVSDQLLKGGINPKAVDTLYTLLNARNAFVDAEDGSLKLKVDVEGGANVALPLQDAIKHFVKSEEGQLFMAPLGAAGSGGKTPTTSAKAGTGKDVPEYRKIDVNWNAVADDMKWSP